jgi:hypothetical protein
MDIGFKLISVKPVEAFVSAKPHESIVITANGIDLVIQKAVFHGNGSEKITGINGMFRLSINGYGR